MKEAKEAAMRLSESCIFFGDLNHCPEGCSYRKRVTDGHVSWNDCNDKFEEDIRTIVNYILSMEDDGK